MFPLGSVLFPSLYLPLHVFETRYRAMVRVCLDGEPEFGVVLIERGSEVGGGDVRRPVGVVARILEVAETDDGRFALGTVGTRRIRVRRWLPDDPYPCAEVEDFDDPGGAALDDLVSGYREVRGRLRRLHAARAELGEPSLGLDQLDQLAPEHDPVLGSYQASALAMLGPADQYALLAAADAASRLELLTRLLDDELAVVAMRLAAEPPPEG